ncbi:MAG: hypothetical protein HZA54_16980 [Planctomycetes bacterium]|nr:hypothetical protein [Planctomycetota bacterium]
MEKDSGENVYLQQIQAAQKKVAVDLKARRAAPAAAAGSPALMVQEESGTEADLESDTGVAARGGRGRMMRAAPGRAGGGEGSAAAVDLRITGWWHFQTVVVPPNAYVVHTRRGHAEPLHLGLGISFPYDPYTDSFLVVPSTMQTILINAYCICKELQGLVVQGYVQWIIADFATAYKRLDFTDVLDPMKVVNVQLREQAEAAIKDKVATMGIDEVLSDKQPIIAELTARLRQVAEGEGSGDKGLGLRIVTVQVKEAVVSSTRVWENLQKPFRAQRAQVARLAELASESAIAAQELTERKRRESARLETEADLAALRGRQEAQTFDREQAERRRRHELDAQAKVAAAAREGEVAAAQAELEKLKAEKEAELARARQAEELARQDQAARAEIAEQEARGAAANRQAEVEIGFERSRQEVKNRLSPAFVEARLIETLPAIAERLPKPTELRAVTFGGGGGPGAGGGPADGSGLAALLAQVRAVLDSFRGRGKTVDRAAEPPAAAPPEKA